MQAAQKLTLMSCTFFCGDYFALSLIQEKQVVSYLGKSGHWLILVNCLQYDYYGAVWLGKRPARLTSWLTGWLTLQQNKQ